MSLVVREPGLLSLLVDAGRTGARSLGVPLGGAADRAAVALGNALVGNPPDAVALEVTLSGPALETEHHAAGVVFGAPFRLAVNDRPLAAGTTFTLHPGDILRIGGTSVGVRGYLCVAGGFESPAILGSRSALEPVQVADVLTCAASRCEPRGLGFVSLDDDRGRLPVVIRILDGPQRDWFADERFFSQTYEVTPASNRMGLRLKGEPLARRPGELVSEAVAPGAVQITNDGMPVVLGVDGQTIGGYPKIAHVVRADLDLLAQLRPGDRVRFVRVLWEEAEAAARQRAEVLTGWRARLRAADRQPSFG